jgi:hypothetical protein
MAIYTDIKREEAQTIFSKIGKIKTLEGIQEGVENTNYKVILENESKYILTIFEISPCWSLKKMGFLVLLLSK